MIGYRTAEKLTLGLLWGRGPSVTEILDMDRTNAYKRIAEALDECAADNDKIIRRRSTWVVACGFFLAAQVLLWIANVLFTT